MKLTRGVELRTDGVLTNLRNCSLGKAFSYLKLSAMLGVKSAAMPAQAMGEQASNSGSTIVQFVSPEGEPSGPPIDVPLSSTPAQLEALLNSLLENEEPLPYAFLLTETRTEVIKSLTLALSGAELSAEKLLSITYQPQSVFRVRAVTRCTASLPGHAEAVLSSAFAPDSSLAATGSGDTTVRLWSIESPLPKATLAGHTNWVLTLAFSPDGMRLASASMDKSVRLWDIANGVALGRPLLGHRKWVTSVAWQPYHIDPECTRLVSGSKDSTLRIWNASTFTCVRTLAGHAGAVTCVRWSGEGFIYSASQDRTIRVWNPTTGHPHVVIGGHGHWVNTMALSTDAVLRCGAFALFDEKVGQPREKLTAADARARYEMVKRKSGSSVERMVSGSDDFTLLLWEDISAGEEGKKPTPKTRMTGHQQLVNDVCYSPDGLYVASASFDKSLRLWDGATGKFIATFRGHVGPVYRVVWSADSRLMMSSSRDSTCKVWQLRTRKLKADLPGHSDEVYTVDWSPDGKFALSAGKDRIVKIWHH